MTPAALHTHPISFCSSVDVGSVRLPPGKAADAASDMRPSTAPRYACWKGATAASTPSACSSVSADTTPLTCAGARRRTHAPPRAGRLGRGRWLDCCMPRVALHQDSAAWASSLLLLHHISSPCAAVGRLVPSTSEWEQHAGRGPGCLHVGHCAGHLGVLQQLG